MPIDLDAMLTSGGRPIPVNPNDALGLLRRPIAGVPATVDAGNIAASAATDAGVDTGGMARRMTGPIETADPYAPGGSAGNFSRGVSQGVSELGTGLRNLKGIGQAFIGDEQGARDTFAKSKAEQEFAARRGPAVQDISDVMVDPSKAGAYAAGFAGSALPTVASMLLPGGVAGKGAKVLAERAIAKEAASLGAGVAERAIAGGATKEAAGVAAKEATAAAAKELAPAAATAKEIGHVAGSAVGALPPTVASSTDALTDPDSPDSMRTRAGKVLAGDAVASVIGALPIARLLNRTGVGEVAGKEIAETTKKFIPRVTAEMAKQAGLQGTLGVAQTAAVLATHKWVNDNIDLMSPQAIDQYINAAAGGALLGAATGGAFEAVRGASLPGLDTSTLKTKFSDTVRDFKKATSERPKPGQPMGDAHTKFEENFDSAAHDAGIDAALRDIDKVHENFQSGEEPLVGETARQSNPVQFADPVQNAIAGFIPKDHPIWDFDDTLKPMVEAGAKALRGEELSTKEKKSLSQLGEFIGEDRVHKILVSGEQYGDLLKKAKGLEPEGGVKEQAAETVADAPEHVAQEVKPSELPTNDLTDRLVQAEPGSPEHTALQTDLRERMIGHRDDSPDRKYAEMRAGEGKNNVIVGNNKAQVEKTLKRGFEIDTDEHSGKPLIVDIQNLVKKKLASNPGDAIGALSQVMGDLHLAGVKVKPETIRTGVEFAPDRKLTANEAKALREQAKQVPPTPERAAGPAGEAAQGTIDTVPEKTKNFVGDFEPDPGHELLPKTAPPADKGGGIAEVAAHMPHDKVLNDYVKARAEAKTPAERAALRHEAGVKIGRAELAKQQADGQISDRRLATEVKRLENPESGLSRQYLKDANEGKFDSFTVREAKADTAEPKVNEARTQAQTNVEKAFSALEKKNTGRLPDSTPEKAMRERAAELAAKPRSELNAHERAYLAAARDAGFVKAKESTTPDAKVISDRTAAAEREKAAVEKEDTAKIKFENEIDTGVKSAAKDGAKYDYNKETKMANAILGRAGVKSKVTVKEMPSTMLGVNGKRPAGSYNEATKTIYLNPEFTGAERIEVLSHEIGHHIIRATVGDQLQKASPELRAALDADYKKWLNDSFTNEKTVAQIQGSKKPAVRAERLLASDDLTTLSDFSERHGDRAVDYLFDREEWMADHIARFLTTDAQPRNVVEQFFKNIADALKAAYENLFGSGDRAKYAPAKSVEAWMRDMFDRTSRDAATALDRPVSKAEAEAFGRVATEAAAEAAGTPPGGSGEPPRPSGGASGAAGGQEASFKAWAKFFRTTLSADERRIFRNALDRRVVEKQIREAYADQPDVIKVLDNPDFRYDMLSRLAYKMWAKGDLKLGPHFTEVSLGIATALRKMVGVSGNSEFALKLFEDIQNGQLEGTKKAGNVYDVRKTFAEGEHAAAQAAYNQGRQIGFDYIYQPLRKAFWDVSDKLHSSDTPALSKIGGLMKLHGGEGGRKGQVGILNDLHIRRQHFINGAANALGSLTDAQKTEVHRLLQERADLAGADGDTGRAATKMRKLFEQAHAYAKDAGVDLKHLDKYYPVVMDAGHVREKTGDFKKLMTDVLQNPEAEKQLRSLMFDGGKPTTMPVEEMVDKLVASASKSGPEAQLGESVMSFRAKNPRLMQFVYDHGSPEQIKQFAGFQEKNPEAVLRPYFDQLTRTAEWTRRFGAKDERFDRLIEQAKKQGANPDDIAQAQLYRDVMKGTYSANGSPVLKKFLGENIANKVANQKTKVVSDYLMAYQNARTLPLTLLSSLADPMGIFVRSGGDFGGAWNSFVSGVRAQMGKGDQKHLRDLYQAIGQADDFMVSDMLSNGYSSDQLSTLPRKISDTVFKWNGLTWYTKATRYMALSAGERFLVKHNEASDATSKRYLNELGMQAGDVKSENGRIKLLSESERESASKAELARDDRVRTGLNRFVDEAILRTDASQRPIWFNDPYMGIVTQYKSFAYAFDAQIISRIKHEAHYSNFKVLAPAAAYFPITAMGEMLRAGVQYGPGGNPRHDDWGPAEYTAFLSRRTGLLGPRLQFGLDSLEGRRYANMGQMLELGPTIEQAGDVASAFEGHRAAGRTLVDALPASALYRHWEI